MGNLWEIYGKSLENLWEIYGKSMEHLWKIYGKSMGNLWNICGKSMGNLWEIYGTSVENLWEIYGKSMEHLWKIYGKSMENPREICGKSMENLWKIYGKSMEHLWKSIERGNLMDNEWKFFGKSLENLCFFFLKIEEHLWTINRKSMDNIWNLWKIFRTAMEILHFGGNHTQWGSWDIMSVVHYILIYSTRVDYCLGLRWWRFAQSSHVGKEYHLPDSQNADRSGVASAWRWFNGDFRNAMSFNMKQMGDGCEIQISSWKRGVIPWFLGWVSTCFNHPVGDAGFRLQASTAACDS